LKNEEAVSGADAGGRGGSVFEWVYHHGEAPPQVQIPVADPGPTLSRAFSFA